MNDRTREILKKTGAYRPLFIVNGYWMWFIQSLLPDKVGRAPSWLHKISTVKKYGRTLGANILVETGTYRGDTINGCKRSFDTIYSVELGDELYKKAMERFAGDANIHLFLGDSAAFLKQLVPKIIEKVVYWLDAHYSGGVTVKGKEQTPIIGELETVLSHWVSGSAILIDDAGCFDGKHAGYPSLEELRCMVAERNPKLSVEVKRNIIRMS